VWWKKERGTREEVGGKRGGRGRGEGRKGTRVGGVGGGSRGVRTSHEKKRGNKYMGSS